MLKFGFGLLPLWIADAANCTVGDIAMWRRDPTKWNNDFEKVAASACGIRGQAYENFRKLYPKMTLTCVGCQIEIFDCGSSRCLMDCFFDAKAPQCKTCMETHCITPYYTCIGTWDPTQTPIPPWEL